LNGWKNCAKDGNPQNSYIVINRKPTTQSTSEVLTEQFEEYRKSAEGFYRLCDILGKPRNVDVMVSEVNQLITVEKKLQQSDKDLASFKNQLFDITEQLEQKTKDLDQLKIDNKNLQDKVDVQTRTIIELDGSIESAMDQIEELKKQADRPIGSYSGIELIVKGFVKLFGKK
jgi:chromosome segregation ATPase